MIYLINGKEINGQFSHKGVTYPSNWLELSSEDDRNNLGIIILNEVYPTLADGQKYDGTYVDDYTNGNRIYNVVDKTTEDLNVDINIYNLSINRQINDLTHQQTLLVPQVLLNIDGAKDTMNDLMNQIIALKAKLKANI